MEYSYNQPIKIHLQYSYQFTLIPNNNSGARYQSVTTIGVYAFNGEPYSRARPKSAIYQ